MAQTASPAYILGATAITEVFGDGQRLVAVAVKHDRPVDPDALDPALYAVEDRTITRVYASASSEPAAEGTDGPYVIVELSPDDEAALLFVYRGASATRRPAATTVTITPAAAAAPEESGGAEGGPRLRRSARWVPTESALIASWTTSCKPSFMMPRPATPSPTISTCRGTAIRRCRCR